MDERKSKCSAEAEFRRDAKAGVTVPCRQSRKSWPDQTSSAFALVPVNL